MFEEGIVLLKILWMSLLTSNCSSPLLVCEEFIVGDMIEKSYGNNKGWTRQRGVLDHTLISAPLPSRPEYLQGFICSAAHEEVPSKIQILEMSKLNLMSQKVQQTRPNLYLNRSLVGGADKTPHTRFECQ